MGFTGIILLNLYSVIILIIVLVYLQIYFEKNNVQQSLFLLMILTNIIMLILDTFGRFDGHLGTIFPFLNMIGNFFGFLLSPILPSLWLIYANNQVNKENKIKNTFLYPILLIFAINTAIVILSQFNGCIYTIDQYNIYHRGPYFWLEAIIMLGFVVASFILIVKKRNNIDRQYAIALLFFVIPPSICVIIQSFIYGTSLIYNGIAISLFIVFLNIQNRVMHLDYLTGVNNRKRLDVYLKEKILLTTESNTFSLILVDINNFKTINDLYGHTVGDDALEIFAMLLKNCLRTTDFIARYGGDEFVVILDVSNERDLLLTIDRINLYFKNFNNTSFKQYKLELSMGYEVYDPKSKMTANEFLKHVDLLMYENKQKNKEIKIIK